MGGYNQGYADGYRAGLADGLAGKVPGGESAREAPLAFLNLSVRPRNALTALGCVTVADVAGLPEATILRIRGLGRLGAGEVARALRALGVFHTDWDRFLLDAP